jgi:hypothetical protein
MRVRSSNFLRRDLVVLPCLSLLTIVFLLIGSEATARYFFVSSEADSCEVSDARIGFTFKPNCTSQMKVAEGPWVTNQYNACGYRTRDACGRVPAGASRIALIGSSASEGLYVDYDHTFATRTAVELTQRCHRPVETQNLGRLICSPACAYHRVDEALALKPDVLVLAISPHDIETMSAEEVRDRDKPIPPTHPAELDAKKGADTKRLQKVLTGSRSVTAAEHFIFQDPATYLKMYLVYGDKADFLRQPFTAAWQRRFADFDLLLGEMAEKARAANVPFYLVEIPSLAQSSILAMQTPPAGQVSATALNRELAAIAARHGVQFVDVLETFRKTPGANKYFYMVDGHLNADGEALISGPLVEQLVAGKGTVFSGCDAPVETASNQAVVKARLR